MNSVSPPVFYYHSVAPKPLSNWGFNFLTMPLKVFEKQLIYLKGKGRQSIFLEEWQALRLGNRTANGNEVCLTFDDGFLDNWVYVFPLAKRYGIKCTLFVAPECLDPRNIIRPNLEDAWKGNCTKAELETAGFVSWQELKIMQESGIIDVQSHTMSHNKYVCSDTLQEFYYGGTSGIYPIWNIYPDIKPFYINDPIFEERLPLGTPLFGEKSAVIAKKHQVNPLLIHELQEIANQYDLKEAKNREDYENKARKRIREYRESGALITHIESDEAYHARLQYEIFYSKQLIEEKLEKPVNFLCWPHGDNSEVTHGKAMEAGYRATTSGRMLHTAEHLDRIPRMGAAFQKWDWWTRQKFHYKFAVRHRQQPYYAIHLTWQLVKSIIA